jgi:hypothetical protein
MNGPGFMLPTMRMLDNFRETGSMMDERWRYQRTEPEIKIPEIRVIEPIKLPEYNPMPVVRIEPIKLREPVLPEFNAYRSKKPWEY